MKKICVILFIAVSLAYCSGPKGASKKDRRDAERNLHLAENILKRRNLSNAELREAYTYLKRAESGLFDDYKAFANLKVKQGYVRYLQRRYNEALNLLTKAISLDKRIKDAYLIKIKIYLIKREYGNAWRTSREGIDKIDRSPVFYYYAAESLFHLKRYIKSEEAFQKYLESSASLKFRSLAKLRIKQLKRLIAADNEAGSVNLGSLAHKTIITFDDVAKITLAIIDFKSVLNRRGINYTISDPYSLLRIARVYDKSSFLRTKYVSRGDLAYIGVKLLEFVKNKSLGLENKYTSNPGVPDLNASYYAFKHVLFVIEQNIMGLKDSGNFGVASNAGALECIKLMKEIKLRAN